MRLTKIRPVFLITVIVAFQSCSAAKDPVQPFFFQKWGLDFQLRTTETGDTLSIGAAFSNGLELFVNDQAAGTVVAINTAGKVISKTPLERIGRGTYSGDDFILKDSQFVFVNSVDKRLEYFNRSTGKHLRGVPLPSQVLASQTKRSDRMIDRIFLVDKAIFVGNGRLLFDLGAGLKKSASPVTLLKAPGTSRYTLLAGKKRFMTTGNFIADSVTGKKAAVPASHFTINGKRFAEIQGRLFSIIAAKEGIKIVDCGLVVSEVEPLRTHGEPGRTFEK